MAIDSPLGSLCKVLKQLRDIANRNETALKRSEAATRATLVDPLLRALGWDITDVTMVELEKVKGDFRADYVLLDPASDTKVIVEAKALGSELDDYKTVVKLFTYAANFHCNSVFITDGRHWHHHMNINIMDQIPSKILKINSDDLTEIAAYLVQRVDASWFWRSQPDNLTLQIQQLQMQVEQMSTELRSMRELHKDRVVITKNPIEPDAHTQYVPLSELGDMNGKSISALRINGKDISVKYWKDLLVSVAELVLHHQQFTLPLFAAGNSQISLLGLTPLKAGVSHRVLTYKNEKVYLYTNYCANNIIKNSLHMLTLLPEDQRKVELLVAEK